MKKIVSTILLTLAVMVGNAATPVELKEYKQSTYECAYFDWWYFGYSEASQFGYVLFDANHNEIAFTVLSQSETDYVTYLDGVEFKDEHEDRDVESHYYISTYWILNSLNGVRWGGSDGNQEVVANNIKEIEGTSGESIYALRTGSYYLRVYEINYAYDDATGAITGVSVGGYDQVQFSISGDEPRDLKAEVAGNKKTATISWTKPSLPADAHLYLNVRSGAQVAYDNYNAKKSPDNPLTVDVEEGRTYSVTAQYVTSRNVPLGSAQTIYFTVGTNQFTPTNVQAVIDHDDFVTFSWSAAQQAERYMLNVYQNSFIYAQYTISGTSTTKQLPTGTYTWSVAAYEKGEDDLYYALTEHVSGNSFTTKTAPLPEGTIELNIWGMEAFYMEEYASGGQYPWLITLESGTSGSLGYPEPWIIIWSDRETGLSGTYSDALNNVEMSNNPEEGTMINTNGQTSGLLAATSVEFRLDFEGFDSEYIQLGYLIPYYSGEMLMTCDNGAIYHATFTNLMCGTYPYDASFSRSTVISMYDENGEQGIEDIVDARDQGTKRLENGQLIIERNGVRYNVLGTKLQ